MKRTVWADEQVESMVNRSFIPVTIHVDTPEASSTRELFQINLTPSTVVVDSHGNVLDRRVGGIGKDEFLEVLQKCSNSNRTR